MDDKTKDMSYKKQNLVFGTVYTLEKGIPDLERAIKRQEYIGLPQEDIKKLAEEKGYGQSINDVGLPIIEFDLDGDHANAHLKIDYIPYSELYKDARITIYAEMEDDKELLFGEAPNFFHNAGDIVQKIVEEIAAAYLDECMDKYKISNTKMYDFNINFLGCSIPEDSPMKILFATKEKKYELKDALESHEELRQIIEDLNDIHGKNAGNTFDRWELIGHDTQKTPHTLYRKTLVEDRVIMTGFTDTSKAGISDVVKARIRDMTALARELGLSYKLRT
ncbi:MAG: hypothetical protein ABIG84_02740 [archaeon]